MIPYPSPVRILFFSMLIVLMISCPLLKLQAICWNPFPGPHYICVGPEFEFTVRKRSSTKKMEGFLYGAWISYDRIHPFSWYYGAEGYWVTGNISNEAMPLRTKALKTESDIEGRVGFTFQSKSWRCWTLIPYIGYGYFRDVTRFRPTSTNTSYGASTSTISLSFYDRFEHYSAGFLSGCWLTRCLAIGLNFKWKYMNNGEQEIRDDPSFSPTRIRMGDKALYEIALPITYLTQISQINYSASLIPFYRYRQYGKRECFPFDFHKTVYRNYGTRVTLNFIF